MAFKLYMRVGGIPTTREEDTGQRLEDLPGGLESKPDDELRWNGTAIEDATDNTEFWINTAGEKCLLNDDAAKISSTGSYQFNKRPSLPDRIERTVGSFVTDGFQVGDIISPSGSTSNDKPLKITVVNVLNMEIDENADRLANEGPLTVTLETGYQKLEGITWADELYQDVYGIWRVKTDAQKHAEAKTAFETDLLAHTDAYISENGAPYPARRRDPAEYEGAKGRIIRSSATFGADDIYDDQRRYGKPIFDKDAASASSLTLTFSASGKTITRAAGSWTTDGFKAPQSITIVDSNNNDNTFTIKEVTSATVITVSSADTLVDETATAGCSATSLSTGTGYRVWRGNDTPGDALVTDFGRFIEEAIVIIWFTEVETARKNWNDSARLSDIWAISTVYALDDFVFDPLGKKFYKCTTAHTSGTGSFQDDIANWSEHKVEDVTYDAYPTTQIAS